MHIEEVVIEGFKSYATRTVITGWDSSFNAITGLNGSGKSNILDAICFVLGIDNLKQVRASNLQDLIYKRGQAGVTRASVTIVFSNEDPSQSPIGYKDSPRLTVSRQIAIGGKNKYLINGHNAQKMAVENLFQSVQLNVNNPHFLIMQGQITRILSMRPLDTLALVEEAAGTRMFEDRKERAISTLTKKEGKVDEIDSLIQQTIHPKLRKLKADRQNFLEWKSKEQDIERLLRILKIKQFRLLKEEIQSDSLTISTSLTEQTEMLARKTEKKSELERLKAELKELQSSLNPDDSRELERLEQEYKQCSKTLEVEETKMSLQVNFLQEMELRSKQLESLEVELRNAIAELYQTSIEPLRERASAIDACNSQKMAELQKDISLLASLQTAGMAAGTDDRRSLTGYAALLKEAREEWRAKQREHDDLLRRQEELRAPSLMLSSDAGQDLIAKAHEEHLELLLKSNEKLLSAKAALKQLQDLKSQKEEGTMDNGGGVITEIPLLQQKLNISKNQQESLRNSLKWVFGSLDMNAQGVHGTIGYILRFKKDVLPEFSTALETAIGSKINNIVVDDEVVARRLLQLSESGNFGGWQRNQQRLTIIPLNRIKTPSKTISPLLQKEADRLAPGMCCSAMSLLDMSKVPPNLMGAVRFVLEGVMLCRTKEAASIAAFNPKIAVKAVTLDGDVYEPWGTLSGGGGGGAAGSRGAAGGKDTLERVQRYHAQRDESQAINALLEDLLRKEDLQRARKKEEVELQRQILLITQKITQQQRSYDASPEGKAFNDGLRIEEEIRGLPEEIEKASLVLKDLSSKLQRLEEENKEWMGDRDGVLERLRDRISKAQKELNAFGNSSEADKNCKSELLQKEAQLEELKLKEDLLLKEKDALRLTDIPRLRAQITKDQQQLMEVVEEKEGKRRAVEVLSLKIKEFGASLEAISNSIRLLKLSLQEGDVEIEAFTQRLSSHRKDLLLKEDELSLLLKGNPFLSKIESAMEEDIVVDGTSTLTSTMAEVKKGIDECLALLKKGKRAVNGRVMEMIEGIEAREAQLQEMLGMVRNDRSLIEGTIGELDHYMLDSLQDTWKKVDSDFDSILSELLPGANGRLVISGTGTGDGSGDHNGDSNDNDNNHLPPEDKEGSARLLVERGLEIRVSLGDGGTDVGGVGGKKKFKSGLAELSGGQRSLVALALILSLLQFKPAPLYILDEVDAALDLHHTEAIGHILRGDRFGGAQFIVVSLKEGMFECANCLFRTKFHDGISGVERVVSGAGGSNNTTTLSMNDQNNKNIKNNSLSIFNKATQDKISSRKKVY